MSDEFWRWKKRYDMPQPDQDLIYKPKPAFPWPSVDKQPSPTPSEKFRGPRLRFKITAVPDDALIRYFDGMQRQYMAVMMSAAYEAKRTLLSGLYRDAVELMGDMAGPGFPKAYTNHLATAMSTAQIRIYDNKTEVSFNINWDHFGGWDELMLGAHQNALLDAPMDEENFKSYRNSTRNQLPRNPLPNTAEEADLYNTKERRTEWWNRAIVHQDYATRVGANATWTKPTVRGRGDAWEVPDVPTFEQVASDRVNIAWVPVGRAPEWLILQYGTPAGSEPTVLPQNFKNKISLLTKDVFHKTFDGYIAELERQMAAGARLQSNRYGRFVPVVGGRYVPYKGAYTKFKEGSTRKIDFSDSLNLIK